MRPCLVAFASAGYAIVGLRHTGGGVSMIISTSNGIGTSTSTICSTTTTTTAATASISQQQSQQHLRYTSGGGSDHICSHSAASTAAGSGYTSCTFACALLFTCAAQTRLRKQSASEPQQLNPHR